jgi:hypothetical protein
VNSELCRKSSTGKGIQCGHVRVLGGGEGAAPTNRNLLEWLPDLAIIDVQLPVRERFGPQGARNRQPRATLRIDMANLGFRATWLRGESDFYLADLALFSVGKQARTGVVPRVQGSLLKLKPLSLPRCRSYRFIV